VVIPLNNSLCGRGKSEQVSGSASPTVAHFEMAEQQTWPWPDQLVVTADAQESSLYSCCKRCLDIVVSSLLLVLLSPLLLLIAILIKLDSRGPAIFKQERVGANREVVGGKVIWVVRNFTIYKFRSMVQGAHSALHEAYIRDFVEGRATPETGGKFKLTNDPRVTAVGRALRKFSLDELPQFFNVLKGDMSLVGPRPVPPYEVACYQNGHHKRLAALPGISGLWQVKGRCQVSFDEMIEMDLEYIRKASLLLDLKILILTVPAVLSRKGAE
jgi:lipopolysaccharide/colanic/teichoic acid biosynthesis glycosyltransferase